MPGTSGGLEDLFEGGQATATPVAPPGLPDAGYSSSRYTGGLIDLFEGGRVSPVSTPEPIVPTYLAPSYWEDPIRIARYYHTINNMPPGMSAPDWLDTGAVRNAYTYFETINGGKPWTEWQPLGQSDPVRSYLRSIGEPPDEFLLPGEEQYLVQPREEAQPTQVQPDQYSTLSPWQKLQYNIMRSPAAMGGAMGAGIGLVAGGPAGIMGGALLGAGLGGVSARHPKVADLLISLDIPAEYTERALGTLYLAYGGIARDIASDKGKKGWFMAGANRAADIINNLNSAWDASHLLWESGALDRNLAMGFPTLHEAAQDFDYNSWDTIDEAYELLKAGEKPEDVYNKMNEIYGPEGQYRDLMGHIFVDPLNVTGLLAGKLIGLMGKTAAKFIPKVAKQGKLLGLSMDLTGGPMAGTQLYGKMLRSAVPTSEIADMGVFSRWLGGVTKEGAATSLRTSQTVSRMNKLAGSTIGGGALGVIGYGIGGPVGGAIGLAAGGPLGWKYMGPLTHLTDVSRATELVNQHAINMAILMEEGSKVGTWEDSLRLLHSVADTPLETAAKLNMKFIESPNGAASPAMLKDFLNKADAMGIAYKATDWKRATLKGIADVTGKEDIGQVLKELDDIDDIATLLDQYVDAARQAGDEGAEIVKAFDDGQLNVEFLEDLHKAFIKDGLPVNDQMFRGQLYGSMMEHAAEWTAKYFNVKPDPTWVGLSRAMKSAQNLFLLGLNPTYLVNNVINNVVTMAASGVLGLRSGDDIARVWARFGGEGWTPPRLYAGVGPQSLGSEISYAAIRDANKRTGKLADIEQAFGNTTNKIGIFARISQAAEQQSSAQAYTAGLVGFWSKIWTPGRGYDRMPDALTGMLGPELSHFVEGAIKGGMGRNEIEAQLWTGATRKTLDTFITDVTAKNPNIDEGNFREMLSIVGADEFLKGKLQKATDDAGIRKAFEDLRTHTEEYFDKEYLKGLKGEAERAKAKTHVEGMAGGLELYDRSELLEAERWLENFDNWQRAFVEAQEMDRGQRNAHFQKVSSEETRKWDRMWNRKKAAYLGIANELGFDNALSRRFIDEGLIKGVDNWQSFHKERWSKLRRFFNTDFENSRSRQVGWDTLQKELDELYVVHTDVEKVINKGMDDTFVLLFERRYGNEAGKAARKWRTGTRDIRDEMIRDMRIHRDSVNKLPQDERLGAWIDFLDDNYRRKIVDRMVANVDGAHEMYRTAMKGQLDLPGYKPGGEPGIPKAPGEPSLAPKGPEPKGGAPGEGIIPEKPMPDVEKPPGQMGLDQAPKVMDLTDQWQAIPEDVAIPPGADIRMDMSTGERRVFARKQQTTGTQAGMEGMPDVEKVVKAELTPEQKTNLGEINKIAQEYGIPTANEAGELIPGSQAHIYYAVKKYGGPRAAEFTSPDDVAKMDPDVVRNAFEVRKQTKEDATRAQLAIELHQQKKVEAEKVKLTEEQKAIDARKAEFAEEQKAGWDEHTAEIRAEAEITLLDRVKETWDSDSDFSRNEAIHLASELDTNDLSALANDPKYKALAADATNAKYINELVYNLDYDALLRAGHTDMVEELQGIYGLMQSLMQTGEKGSRVQLGKDEWMGIGSSYPKWYGENKMYNRSWMGLKGREAVIAILDDLAVRGSVRKETGLTQQLLDIGLEQVADMETYKKVLRLDLGDEVLRRIRGTTDGYLDEMKFIESNTSNLSDIMTDVYTYYDDIGREVPTRFVEAINNAFETLGEKLAKFEADQAKLVDEAEEAARVANEVLIEPEIVKAMDEIEQREQIQANVDDWQKVVDDAEPVPEVGAEYKGPEFGSKIAKAQQQKGMFEAGEDTALFSGTAQKGKESLFDPQTVEKQDAMFDMRPEAKTIEGGEAAGAGPMFSHEEKTFAIYDAISKITNKDIPSLPKDGGGIAIDLPHDHQIIVGKTTKGYSAKIMRPDGSQLYTTIQGKGYKQVVRKLVDQINNNDFWKDWGKKDTDTLFQGAPEKLPSLEEYHQARMSRVKFRQDAIDTGNYTETEVDLIMRLIDAEANYWAKSTGKPATDWYLENIAGVKKWNLREIPSKRLTPDILKQAELEPPGMDVLGSHPEWQERLIDMAHTDLRQHIKENYRGSAPSDDVINLNIQDMVMGHDARALHSSITSTDINKTQSLILETEYAYFPFGRPKGEPDFYYQGDIGPVWNSKLNEVVNDQMPGKIIAEDLPRMLANKGVKKDEMIWTGLDDLLKKRGKEHITKQEIIEHLENNRVEVEEIVRGEHTAEPGGIYSPVKYDQYSLPGGDEYRELLFTLPEKRLDPAKPSAQYTVELDETHNIYQIRNNLTRELLGPAEAERAGGYIVEAEAIEYANRLNVDAGMLDIITSPSEAFRSTHWDESNVLSHVRFNDRVDADGKKVLFIEEMQSDWHQEGASGGYKAALISELPEGYIVGQNPHSKMWGVFPPESDTRVGYDARTKAQAIESAIDYLNLHREGNVPAAPFANTWHELTLRRMLRWAAENGYDRLAWTTGKQQVERWGTQAIGWEPSKMEMVKPDSRNAQLLTPDAARKHHEAGGEIFFTSYNAPDGTRVTADVNNKILLSAIFRPETDLKFWAGKSGSKISWDVRIRSQLGGEVAGHNFEQMAVDMGLQDRTTKFISVKSLDELEKLLGSKLTEYTGVRLEKLAKRVWNQMQKEDTGISMPRREFMEYLYDNRLKSYLNKYGKKWGAKVGESDIAQGVAQPFVLRDAGGQMYITFDTLEEAQIHKKSLGIYGKDFTIDDLRSLVPSIDITPDMRRSVLKGQYLFKDAKGAVQFLKDGRAMIYAFESADISTLVHEVGHIFRRHLTPEDLKVAERWTGVKNGDWQRPHEEQFARGFEQYLYEGKAPNKQLASVFKNLQTWLTEIYAKLRGNDIIKLNDEMRALFDRLLGERPDLTSVENGRVYQGIDDVGTAKAPVWFETDTGLARLLDETDDGWRYEKSNGEVKTLFQGEDPEPAGMPVGTVDAQDDIPVTEMTEQAWNQRIWPVLQEVERNMLGPNAHYKNTLNNTPLDPISLRALKGHLATVYGQLGDAKAVTARWAENRRDAGLLNYGRRYGFDNIISAVFPYEFWYTRSAMQWALRAIDQPGWLATYSRLRTHQKNMEHQPGFPERMRNKIKMPNLPFLPKFAGGTWYADPIHQVFPFEQLVQIYDRPIEQLNQQEKRAAYKLEAMVAEEQITFEEGQQALASKDGAAWNKAMSIAKGELNNEINNPFDYAKLISSPMLPWEIGYQMLRGTPEKISLLPGTRLLQSLTAGVTPGGFNIEAPLRKAFGLPENTEYWDFYVDRELANMVAVGELDLDAANLAMVDKEGDAYSQALDRVGKVQAFRNAGAAFWLDFFPEGEERQRGLQQEFSTAVANGRQSVTEFFDKYPEYESRLLAMKWGDPEERMRTFLRGQIWNGYFDLPELEKRAAAEQFGDVFTQNFLNRETRSYDSIDTETFAYWAQTLNGVVPETAPGTPQIPLQTPDQQETDAYQEYQDTRNELFPNINSIQDIYFSLEESGQDVFIQQHPELKQYWMWRAAFLAQNPEMIPYALRDSDPIKGAPPEIQHGYFQYRAERDRLFPNYYDLNGAYFDLQTKVEKRAYRADHPELVQSWEWQKWYLAQFPELIPFIKSTEKIAEGVLGDDYQDKYSPLKGMWIDMSQFEPALARQLIGAAFARQPLTEGARTALVNHWIQAGSPGQSVNTYLESIMYQLGH